MKDTTPALLLRICTSAKSLEQFLDQSSLPDNVTFALDTTKHSDVAFHTFLKGTFLDCPSPSFSTFHWPSEGTQVASMRDLVHLAISMHLDAARFRARSANVLCLGYRPPREEQATGIVRGTWGIENHYPNGLLSHVLTREWERLLAILGDDLIMYLLKNAVIIVRRPAGDLLQVAGPPVTETWSATRSAVERKSPTVIRRHQMLYAGCGSPPLRGGLPFRHPLNKGKSARKVQCLTSAIFHLPASRQDGKIYKILADFTARLIKRHRQCPYAHLYDYHCADFDTPILTSPVSRMGLCGAVLWKNVVGPERVLAFLKATLVRLLAPSERLRSLSSFQHIVDVVHSILVMRKHESIDVEHLMNGLSTKETWSLISNGTEGSTKYCGREEAQMLRLVVKHFLAWTLNGLVIPLIKNNFYVTESSLHRNRLFFFRRDRWKTCLDDELSRLVGNGFLEPLSADFDPRRAWQPLGLGTLRFLPKELGFRPLANTQRRVYRGHLSTAASTNNLLRDIHAVLNYYRHRHPIRLGSSVICMNEVYERLRRFKASHGATLGEPLFMIKVDLKSCYDTIPHGKLLDVIKDLIDAPEYIIRRYETLCLTNGHVKQKSRRSAHPIDDVPAALEGAGKSLLVDRVVGQRMSRRRILQLIEEHVTRNIVTVNGSCYRQRVGIPQGSILSTLLCSFFYADADRVHLARFREHAGSLLMRFVDDMIFISSDGQLVDEFVHLVTRGLPDYGAVFNVSKTVANFAHSLLSPAAACPSASFPWCGLLLDPVTLRITADYGKFFGMPIADAICIDYVGRSPAGRFAQYLCIYMQPKLHPLFLSAELNDHDLFTISVNIYQCAIMVALKSHAYRRDLKHIIGRTISDELLLRTVKGLSKYAELQVRALCKIPIIHGSSLTRTLVLRAFLEVWRRKFTSYHGVIPSIETACRDEELRDMMGDELRVRVLAAGVMILSKVQL